MSANVPLPFYNPIDPTHPQIYPDYTLIIPICAVGNIGQLACDLIISTLLSKQECNLIGRIHSPSLMSVVGPNAFCHQKSSSSSPPPPPTTSTEVYESKKHKLIIIQQRTSYYKDLKSIYIEELVRWVKESQFYKVLVLSSSFAQCNPDTSILGTGVCCPLGSITTSAFEQGEQLKKANIKPIPNKKTIKLVQDGLTFLPGSGITKPLIKAMDKASIAAAFIVAFCSEGVNIMDCYEVVSTVDKLLDINCSISKDEDKLVGSDSGDFIKQAGWVEPYSWRQV